MVKVVFLLLIFVLAGCSQPTNRSTAPAVTNSTPAVAQAAATIDTGTINTATITVAPTSGYAGIFVDVSGAGWPVSAMVLVKLANEHGLSSVLAAIAADAEGRFTTGFVYPVGDRWLRPGAQTVLAHTEDGQVEATAPFTVVPPEGVIAPTSTPTATVTASQAVTPAATATAAATATSPPAPSITATITFTTSGLASVPFDYPGGPPVATPRLPAAPETSYGNYAGTVSTIDELADAINRMPVTALDPKLAKSLMKKLSNAQKQVSKEHICPAVNMLRAFQNEVEAQRGKHIADDAAAFLVDSVGNVIAQLLQSQPGGKTCRGD